MPYLRVPCNVSIRIWFVLCICCMQCVSVCILFCLEEKSFTQRDSNLSCPTVQDFFLGKMASIGYRSKKHVFSRVRATRISLMTTNMNKWVIETCRNAHDYYCNRLCCSLVYHPRSRRNWQRCECLRQCCNVPIAFYDTDEYKSQNVLIQTTEEA